VFRAVRGDAGLTGVTVGGGAGGGGLAAIGGGAMGAGLTCAAIGGWLTGGCPP
jgi:hypothetical protein